MEVEIRVTRRNTIAIVSNQELARQLGRKPALTWKETG